MVETSFFLKGDICYSSSPDSLECTKDSFLLCADGKSGGIFKNPGEAGLPSAVPIIDHSGMLIIPGLTDLHVHAPQFAFRALGMDLELLEWLNKNAFPEEAKYRDLEYAQAAYSRFVEDEKKGPNTRLCVFATVHVPAALRLMELLEDSRLVSLVGKVSMDRNCPDYLKEDDAFGSAVEWLDNWNKHRGRYKNTAPIITPRFIPSCSDGLMKSLAGLQGVYSLPLQSHLSENRRELEWVRELCPQSENYAGAYADAGLLNGPAILAHCVWPEKREMDFLAKKGVYIAHCPQSNINLSSGIAPVRRLLEKGVKLGLGSDIAGGAHSSIFRAMSDAIQVSKLRQILTAPEDKALTLEEAFYLGTAGGGSFFGKITSAFDNAAGTDKKNPSAGGNDEIGPAGSFEPGWDFDALIIDDSSLLSPQELRQKPSLRDRLERVVYLSDDRHIKGKYVRGVSVF